MTGDLDVVIRCLRAVALLHPTFIRRAPIGTYFHYDDSRIRLRVSDQLGLDDFAVWAPIVGDGWETVLLWSPYAAEPERPQIFLPGDWILYLRTMSACRSRQWLDWRAARWKPGTSRAIAAI
jgi:hypothetical protein